MTFLSTIYLFIHAPAKRPMREGLKKDKAINDRWLEFVAEAGKESDAAVCIIQGGFGGAPELVGAAVDAFGDRCIVDPEDRSDGTKCLIADDLERTFEIRGSHGEWNHYEIWSSNNGRRWAEGLKAALSMRQFTYDPASVRIETFGNWTGCHHKYSNYLATYLGAANPAYIHAGPEECVLKDLPMPAAETVEQRDMDNGVKLFLFRRSDGCPMAQFWDGLRGVWEPPHTATISVDPSRVTLYTFSPNSYIPVDGASTSVGDGVVLDVGDGARPAYSTLVGESIRDLATMDFDEFRELVLQAHIKKWERKASVFYRVEI